MEMRILSLIVLVLQFMTVITQKMLGLDVKVCVLQGTIAIIYYVIHRQLQPLRKLRALNL